MMIVPEICPTVQAFSFVDLAGKGSDLPELVLCISAHLQDCWVDCMKFSRHGGLESCVL